MSRGVRRISDFNGADWGDRVLHDSVRGIRSFQIIDTKLASPSRTNYVWKTGENKACCSRRMPGFRRWLTFGHVAGQLDCSCGFYAYHGANSDSSYGGPLWGVVEGYGRVTIGSHGFRAQKAKILALAWKEPYTKLVTIPGSTSISVMATGSSGEQSLVYVPPQIETRTIPLKDFFNLNNRYDSIPIFDSKELLLAEYPLYNPRAS